MSWVSHPHAGLVGDHWEHVNWSIGRFRLHPFTRQRAGRCLTTNRLFSEVRRSCILVCRCQMGCRTYPERCSFPEVLYLQSLLF